METPQAEYDALVSLIKTLPDPIGKLVLPALYRLRPRGIKLTVAVFVLSQDRLKILAVTRKVDAGLPVEQRRVCFPGGHVEAEDLSLNTSWTNENAARRELKEETNLIAQEVFPVFAAMDDCNNYCSIIRAFIGDYSRLKAEENTEALWLTPNEFMGRCAWPKFYYEARLYGVF